MNLLFESPSWVLSCSIIVLVSVAASLGLLRILCNHISTEELKKGHDVVGFTFSIVGVLYNVILGFTVVNVQQRYNDGLKMMWSLLIFGALITTCFMFFFGLESIKSQMIMTSLLVGYIGFILHLVYSLDHVFKGPEGIKPLALQEMTQLFDRWDQNLTP